MWHGGLKGKVNYFCVSEYWLVLWVRGTGAGELIHYKSIWYHLLLRLFCAVIYSSMYFVEVGAALTSAQSKCLWRSKSAAWWAWTKWLSYCNSHQGWDAWIQSMTWKAGSLVSHTAHNKEQTGEWHQAFLWSSRSREKERVVDSASLNRSISPSLLSHSYSPFSFSFSAFVMLSFVWLTPDFFFPPRHSWLRS